MEVQGDHSDELEGMIAMKRKKTKDQ